MIDATSCRAFVHRSNLRLYSFVWCRGMVLCLLFDPFYLKSFYCAIDASREAWRRVVLVICDVLAILLTDRDEKLR